MKTVYDFAAAITIYGAPEIKYIKQGRWERDRDPFEPFALPVPPNIAFYPVPLDLKFFSRSPLLPAGPPSAHLPLPVKLMGYQ